MVGVMIPKTVEELAILIDLLRDKRVAHFEMGDLKIVLGSPEGDEEPGEPVEELAEAPERNPPPEKKEPSPITGLTPEEEEDLFHSST